MKKLHASIPLLSLLALATPGSGDELISNLAEPWTGDIQSPGPGIGFAISFATGQDWFDVDSVTLEHQFYDPANNTSFHVLLYKVDFPSSSTTPVMTLLGELGNPTIDPATSHSPGESTFIDYSPLTPMVLQPVSQYMVAGFTTSDATWPWPSLLFTSSDGFSALPGWQLANDYFGLQIGSDVYWSPPFYSGHLIFRVDGSVPPNRPPDVSQAVSSVATIWPADGKFVPFQILGVTDPDGDPVTITINSIEQDEPVVTPGVDKTSPDAILSGGDTAWVRAERLGSGNGRVYKVSFIASDGKPNGTASGTVFIQVPHDNGAHATAIDDGGLTGYYDSTGP